jgi:hypothetical protein
MSRKKLLGLGLPELLAAKAVWEEIRNRDNFSYEALMILMSRELEMGQQGNQQSAVPQVPMKPLDILIAQALAKIPK